jgi:tetratricopeptide (TPR) repeat protein
MYRTISCAAGMLLAFCLAGPASADDIATCLKAAGDDATIAACTRLLNRRDAVRDAILDKRGQAHFNKGEYDQAMADFEQAVRFNPKNADHYVNRGFTYDKKGDYARAIADYDTALKLNPNQATARENRTTALAHAAQPDADKCRAGVDDDAIAACGRLLNFSGGVVRDAVYRTRGSAYFSRGEYDLAIADFGQAINGDPKNAGHYSNRGAAYFQKGEYDRAIADYGEAIRLDPKLVTAYNGRGMAYIHRDEYDRAIPDIDQALRLAPNDANLYDSRAQAYNGKGEYDRAIAELDHAIRLDPKLAVAYDSLGDAYIGKGEYDRAIGDLDQAVRLDPKGAKAYGHRGFAYGKKGDFDRALADLDKALALDPQYARGYSARAAVYEMRGDLGRAIADYDQALRFNPNLANARRDRDRVQAALEARPEPAKPGAIPPEPALRRVALVIGNAAYRAAPALSNPRRDAEAVAEALKHAGFQTVELAVDLDRDGMVKALRAFRREADRADWALIYFAGHGIEIDRVNYLIPVDAQLADDRDVTAETVSYDDLVNTVGGARALRLIILDACRNNPFKDRMHRAVASRSAADRGLAPPPEPEAGTLVAYSAKDGQVAADGADDVNSPFARAFIAQLKVPGLEVRRLFDFVRDDVLEATGRRQQPFTYQSLPGRKEYFFVSAK